MRGKRKKESPRPVKKGVVLRKGTDGPRRVWGKAGTRSTGN